jgi:hypothetical protein
MQNPHGAVANIPEHCVAPEAGTSPIDLSPHQKNVRVHSVERNPVERRCELQHVDPVAMKRTPGSGYQFMPTAKSVSLPPCMSEGKATGWWTGNPPLLRLNFV